MYLLADAVSIEGRNCYLKTSFKMIDVLNNRLNESFQECRMCNYLRQYNYSDEENGL